MSKAAKTKIENKENIDVSISLKPAKKNEINKVFKQEIVKKEKKEIKELKNNPIVKNEKNEVIVKKISEKKDIPKVEKIEKIANKSIENENTSKPIKNMKNIKKILFVASEAAPFSRTGGLGDVIGALPKDLLSLGNDVRIVIPLYSNISQDYRQTMKYIGNLYVPLAWRNLYCGVFEVKYEGVIYYFLDNEYYFKRNTIYGQFDDGERFAFFAKASLEFLKIVNFQPDIIHANDWHSALVPVFLDTFYRNIDLYCNIKTVFTIHNIEFQGQYNLSIMNDILGMPKEKRNILETSLCCNYMKGAIEASNIVTTVSNTYANEIKDSYFAYGLEFILRERDFKLKGILNGIDVNKFNPYTDEHLFKNYNINTLQNKLENKKGLCELINLPYNEDKPLIAMITRLTDQKGIDLVAGIIEELLAADIQFVLLGTGNWKYEMLFTDMEYKYKNKCRAIIRFSEDLASKLYSASDIFLMPSRFEPCGLSQMIAMRYGSVPIVRETGGLKDTVKPFNPTTGEGNGFTFNTFNAHDMLNSIWNAVDIFYNNKEYWKKIMKNCMTEDFSWKKSALIYNEIYEELI